ncbi:SRPBCC family protein [Sphaerimonospora thailandensis]|uniref:Carbon monoxide dehydrogenase subunit G n=1 Tax=Sphaerimonospora thailandensis TaxID=795644 RepID=A0A8J3RAE4_9ACTN|nr:SRPBCC family protein [Sphaerimonospora thailandensis]GIH72082.1 hypothetical protein Mth01_43350 [Sphaerimonospora thailandensis]
MALRFEHDFMVPVPAERAWPVLLDAKRVAPCLPGATLESVDGDAFTGRLRVKVGPITITYRGSAAFEDVDPDGRTLTLKASGRETRGAGTASAEVTARLFPEGERTRVLVETSFNVTGRPAQFGRGVLADVGGKLIDRFAANLAGLFEEDPSDAAPTDTAIPAGRSTESEPPAVDHAEPAGVGGGSTVAAPSHEDSPLSHRTTEEQALDLLEIAGGPLVRRLAAPLAALAALTALAVVIHLLRRLLRPHHSEA